MTTLRWAKASASSVTPKLRVAHLLAQGAGTAPKLRISRMTVAGTAPVSLQPIADQQAEAFASVVLQATVGATSPAPDSYHWRQISGPSTSYSDNGGSITVTAPPSMTTTPVVFGVTAILGGQASSEATATITLIPHLNWTAAGGSWVPLSLPTRV